MELLNEIKKSNKKAFNSLVSNHHHILYKTARVFLKNDKEVNWAIQKSLEKSYQDIVNVKTEEDFLPWLLSNLIEISKNLSENNKKNISKKIEKSEIFYSIGDKISFSSSETGTLEYQEYRKSSIVEQYITSIDESLRLIAVLYYYANLSIETISKILKVPEFTIKYKIDKIRIQLYEIIKNKEVDL